MRIIIRIVVILAILSALVYGGLRGYTWYMVKEAMDRVAIEMSQYAEISYGSIYSSPKIDGTVGVDRIVIRPKMSSDEFKIQSVRVSYPDIIQLITAKIDDMPKSMRASISGVSIDLNGPLMSSLSLAQKNKAKEQQGSTGFPLMHIDTLGCGSVESIGIDELTRMGYQTMDVDMDMDYSYEKIKNLFKLNATVRVKGMSGMDLKLAMRVAPSDILRRRKIKPVIDYLRVDTTDAGYAAMRNHFCAAQMAGTEEAFITKNIELLSKEVGATFPNETVEAYKKIMQGNGRVSLEMSPKPGTELEYIDRYPLKDAIDILGVKLSLDNNEVDFSKFEWGKTYSASKQGNPGEEIKEGTATQTVEAAPVYTPAIYRATAVSQLNKYIGYQARIKTRSGLLRDGIIESSEGSSITMRLRAPSGKGVISFPIALSDISSAEVLY